MRHSFAHKKLSAVNFSADTISPKRRIEYFYEDLFEGLYGGVDELNEKQEREYKNKMHFFSLAYSMSKKFAGETFHENQRTLKLYIDTLKDGTDFSKGGPHEKFNNILTILLKDVVKNLKEQGKEHLLKNVFGEYIHVIGEKDFVCVLDTEIMYKKSSTSSSIDEILTGDDFKQADDKPQFLLDHGLSYKRGIEKYYELVKTQCFSEDERQNNPDKVADTMEMFNIAYSMSKLKFHNTHRKSGERYFDHLVAVMDYYFEYEKNPTFEGAMIALLHDIVEDSDIDYDTLELLFGEEIARGVCALSKPSVERYLQTEEEKIFFCSGKKSGFLNSTGHISDDILRREQDVQLDQKEQTDIEIYEAYHNIYKSQRNREYFEHFLRRGLGEDNKNKTDEEKAIDKRDTRIKIYDRIHNTITLPGFGVENIDTIFRKIDETIQYFLPISKKYYPELHKRLTEELEMVLKWIGQEIQKDSGNKAYTGIPTQLGEYRDIIVKYKDINTQVGSIINL